MGGAAGMQDALKRDSSSWTPQQQGVADMTGIEPFLQNANFGQSPPQPTGQPSLFSSGGGDPASSMQLGGNMLSSPPPTAVGTTTGIGGTAAGMPGATGSGGPGPMGGAPMAPSGTTSGIGGTAQGMQGDPSGSPFASSGMNLFGGGNQSQMMQQIMQMLRGGGNAWGT
jgi:hypothetical protein